jgi:UDP:flavonoid glycosyltransferase YjiC (YdhE family)
VVPPGWDQPDKAARVIHGGAALRVSKNAGVGTLREAINGVVDDHGYRAGARRMAAALGAGRGDGLIAGVPGAAAVMVVPAPAGARG